MSTKKKLIEVALPLEAINRESAREKSIRHGHPSTLHLWWARRPLAACRAVLFASLVDDPSSRPEEFPTEEAQDRERQRLFRLIEELVKWENLTNDTVLSAAHAEILKSTDGNPPPVLDPFCGGGSIPLEAQRLGLEAHASDLNPVPVLITKALIEIPPKFAGRPPVNPEAQRSLGRMGNWKGAAGLAEDVRYYGKWMRDEAERRIGNLYPKVRISAAQGGGEATVVAWIWARTVTCPNPACGARMPLVRSFILAAKKGKEAWVAPVIDRTQQPPTIRFEVRTGTAASPDGTVNRRGVTCLACGSASDLAYVRSEAQAGRLSRQLLAVVAEGNRGRLYVSATPDMEQPARDARPTWKPDAQVPTKNHDVDRLPMYGMRTWGDAFMDRQLVGLGSFADLVGEARARVAADASGRPRPSAETDWHIDGYADAVATYLAFAVDRCANYWSSLTPWGGDFIVQTFGRQAVAMVWDHAEANPFSDSTGNWMGAVEWVAKCVETACPARGFGKANQADARHLVWQGRPPLISTDPPYYDNISYADLADFFYVWMRRTLERLYPDLLGTLLTPKTDELVASAPRFGGDWDRAKAFFEEGLGEVFDRIRAVADPAYPLTIFYAFKQAETEGTGHGTPVSTGWETILAALLRAGFAVDGTWPLRTERDQGLKSGSNVLASSIVLVCRPRTAEASSATRRQFLMELQRELPAALRALQHGNIAPVDLAQTAIGPGMAVFSRYTRVLEADGQPMRVRTALALINQVLAETLAEQDGEMDADTRWALTWFDQYGFAEGPFGDADTLAKAKVTSTQGLVDAGVIASARGKVRLLRRDELAADWDPATDARRTVWESAHHLSRTLESNGEGATAALLAQLGEDGDRARDLAYRLYTTCERRGWAQDAQAYNALVVAWPELTRLATATETPIPISPDQASLAL